VNWIPIQDGYDSRADDSWLSTYDSEGDGADNLYKKQDVNLFDSFNPGDEVLFRFRLYSDQYTVAWGWAVDDVYIQEERPLAIDPDELSEIELKIYPNPVSDHSIVEFSLLSKENVELIVRDITGKQIKNIQLGPKSPGVHQFQLDASTFDAGIYFLSLETSNEQKTIRLVKK
jgi:hypothetical protein